MLHGQSPARGFDSRPSSARFRVTAGARRRGRAPRQWGLGTLGSPGAFFVVRKEDGMAEAETKHYIANGSSEVPAAREAIEWAGQTQAQLVDLKFCDLLGRWQHMTLPIRGL